MAALDTNVVVRLVICDDAKQARAAEKLVASSVCTIAPSVLMECDGFCVRDTDWTQT